MVSPKAATPHAIEKGYNTNAVAKVSLSSLSTSRKRSIDYISESSPQSCLQNNGMIASPSILNLPNYISNQSHSMGENRVVGISDYYEDLGLIGFNVNSGNGSLLLHPTLALSISEDDEDHVLQSKSLVKQSHSTKLGVSSTLTPLTCYRGQAGNASSIFRR
mmetsp:Transcript_9849/g.14423  ORF Transcript_9849/g.14423 Transcript_9849/m.14423 type:complete len:162 (-) Transcript_9849:200-685(-)